MKNGFEVNWVMGLVVGTEFMWDKWNNELNECDKEISVNKVVES